MNRLFALPLALLATLSMLTLSIAPALMA